MHFGAEWSLEGVITDDALQPICRNGLSNLCRNDKSQIAFGVRLGSALRDKSKVRRPMRPKRTKASSFASQSNGVMFDRVVAFHASTSEETADAHWATYRYNIGIVFVA